MLLNVNIPNVPADQVRGVRIAQVIPSNVGFVHMGIYVNPHWCTP